MTKQSRHVFLSVSHTNANIALSLARLNTCTPYLTCIIPICLTQTDSISLSISLFLPNTKSNLFQLPLPIFNVPQLKGMLLPSIFFVNPLCLCVGMPHQNSKSDLGRYSLPKLPLNLFLSQSLKPSLLFFRHRHTFSYH